MTVSEHTPGPWKITRNGDSIYRIEGDECEFVCCVSHNNTERNRPQRNPNARLIAKAPALLDALKRLAEHCDCACQHDDEDCCAKVEPGLCAACELGAIDRMREGCA